MLRFLMDPSRFHTFLDFIGTSKLPPPHPARPSSEAITMGTLRGEQIIAQSFKREGVDTIFFMMGGPTGGTAGACVDLGRKGIYVRQEQAAAMMAHAYARVTGKPGICIAPMGPGVA